MAGPTKRKRNWLLPLLALLVVTGSWLVFRWLFPTFTPPVLPVPNGYDELLRVAEMFAPRTGYYDEMSEEELAAVVELNAPALQLARQALQKDCMVTVDWSSDPAGLEQHMKNCSSLREIERAFAAAARHARIDGRMDVGVVCGLDIRELAIASARGGLIVDRMVAQAIQQRALRVLRDQVDRLSSEDCIRLQKKIDASPVKLDEPADVLLRERVFFRQINGRLQSILISGMARTQLQQASAEIETADNRLATMSALLRTHLALRAFRLEKNRLPEKLDQLVPDLLREIPQDRFTASALVYHPRADSYLLYSIGPDGVDDHGAESTDGKTDDLLLEVGG